MVAVWIMTCWRQPLPRKASAEATVVVPARDGNLDQRGAAVRRELMKRFTVQIQTAQ